MSHPKILLFDIETAPIIAYTWAMFMETTDIKFIRRDWFILCWAAKWLDGNKIYSASLPDFRGYKELPGKTEKTIDRGIVKRLWELFDKADIIIAHNLKAFDRKKANTRFIINGMKPPSPYNMVDTLQEAKKEFRFTSNRLGYISDKLCVTRKMDNGGFDTWLGCERGEKRAWDKMVRYCKQDVRALDDVYKEFRPFIRNHPNTNIYGNQKRCTRCNSKEMTKDGFRRRATGIYQRYRCSGCGTPYISENPRKGNIRNDS